MTDNLTPKAIVAALDEHIVGQADAKRAVAVALRNRWRRQKLPPELRDQVRNALPKGLPGGAGAPTAATTSAPPRLPGLPGLGGSALPGLGGFKLPGLPGFGGGKPPEKKK